MPPPTVSIAREAEKSANAEANAADINAQLTSAFLNEDPATTVSAANPNRPVPYHYKGLPPEYRQYVLATQMQQAPAASQQKAAASQEGETWDKLMLYQNTEAAKLELAIEKREERERKRQQRSTPQLDIQVSSSVGAVKMVRL